MSIVIQYDRETGEILKVDRHSDWDDRLIDQTWYKNHPEERVEGAGWLTPKPKKDWDGNPDNWKIGKDRNGNPDLKRLK